MGPPFDSVQLVPITPMSLWYANNELVSGAFVNQLITFGGAPHCIHVLAPGQIRRALGALGTVEVQKEIAPAVGSEPLGAGHLEDHPFYTRPGNG